MRNYDVKKAAHFILKSIITYFKFAFSLHNNVKTEKLQVSLLFSLYCFLRILHIFNTVEDINHFVVHFSSISLSMFFFMCCS